MASSFTRSYNSSNQATATSAGNASAGSTLPTAPSSPAEASDTSVTTNHTSRIEQFMKIASLSRFLTASRTVEREDGMPSFPAAAHTNPAEYSTGGLDGPRRAQPAIPSQPPSDTM